MPELTREEVDVTAALRNILDSYPAGSATLREILQNTDDAGAKKQVLEPVSHSYRFSDARSLDLYSGHSQVRLDFTRR